MSAKTSERALALLRLLGLAAFSFYFLRHRDLLEAVFAQLARADLRFWALAVGAFGITLALNALRLSMVLRAAGEPAPWVPLYRDVIVGTALNAVTLMGAGDAYRAHRLTRVAGSSTARSVSCVVVDRLLGLLLLLGVGAAFLLASGERAELEASLGSWALPAACVLALALAAIFWRKKGKAALRSLGLSRASRRPVAGALLVGLAAVASWLVCVQLLVTSLSLSVSIVTLSYVAPLVTLATLLPISVGGLGVRETGYALLLPADPAGATALGLLQYSTFLVICALAASLVALERARAGSDGSAQAR